MVDENQLNHFIDTHFNQLANSKDLELSLLKELSAEAHLNLIQDNSVSYDEPLIRFVDHIIKHALQLSASDIHIEPYEKICRIRYRQDGILYEVADIPINLASRLATRLKVMAKLIFLNDDCRMMGGFNFIKSIFGLTPALLYLGRKLFYGF